MLRDQIKKDILKAIYDLRFTIYEDQIEVTRTTDPKFGDYTTNICLKISHNFKQSPLEFAKNLADSLKDLPYIEKLEVASPGFINFFIKPSVWQKEVENVLDKNQQYGSNNTGLDKKARIEFVSANPTGPLHFGNARGGPIGDTLGNVLAFCGYKVLREYIDNDRGNQVLELGKTLAARANLVEADEASLTYKGQYTHELAARVADELDTTNLSEDEIITRAGQLGVKIMFEEIIRDCQAMGIKFDYIVHESDLQLQAPKVLAQLEKKGLLKKYQGAVWFAPQNEYLKDKDAVVVKSDGSYTYFTADVVYHQEKFSTGYDLVIDVFGSNTFGHVPKLKALAAVFGFDLAKFVVILYQFVRIKRGEEVVKMSKRAGNFVTTREVLDEVGPDALRFYILMHDANTHMDFDLELAAKKSKENPVYYVQYAHARIASILQRANARGPVASSAPTSSANRDSGPDSDNNVGLRALAGTPSAAVTPRYELLTTNYELALIKQITRLPELVEDIAQNFAVHRLTAYAIDLADSFHKFYENCPVIGKDQDLQAARLVLVSATQIALRNTLKLLGVSAPEKM